MRNTQNNVSPQQVLDNCQTRQCGSSLLQLTPGGKHSKSLPCSEIPGSAYFLYFWGSFLQAHYKRTNVIISDKIFTYAKKSTEKNQNGLGTQPPCQLISITRGQTQLYLISPTLAPWLYVVMLEDACTSREAGIKDNLQSF